MERGYTSPIVPGQTGAASNAQSGLPPSPQEDNQTGVSLPNTNSTTNQPGAAQAVVNAAQSQLNSTATSPLTSYTLVPGAGNAQFSFFPNVLDQYANYTYHIRFSMTTEAAAGAVQKNGSSNFINTPKIIIAESGQTALYNITELTLNTLLPGYPSTGNTADLTTEMTIVEPYGITLIDNMYNAAGSIGIGNYFTTNSYFIEVWFTGYNEDGTIATPSLAANLYKVYQVQLSSLDSTTTESGTTYKLKMITTAMFGHADHVSLVSNSINIGPVTTVGDFFDKLAVTLTAQNANLYEDSHPRISYFINMPNDIRGWQFDQSPTTSQRNSDIQVLSGSVNRPTISIARGMDINTILNFVMSMTKDGMNYTAGEPTGTSGGASGSANLRDNGMVNLLTVQPMVKLITPKDPLINDYRREVTYRFMKHPTNRLIIDQKVANTARQPAQQKNRQESLAQSKRFIKHYFWTYTGQNLDVLKFELKLEWSKQVPVPSNLGRNTYANSTAGPQVNPNSVGTQAQLQYQSAKLTQIAAQESLAAAKTSPSSAAQQERIAYFQQQLDQSTAQLNAIQTANPNINFQRASGTQSSSDAAQRAAANTGEQNARTAANTVGKNSAQNLTGVGASVLRQSLYLEDIEGISARQSALPISSRANPSPTNQATTVGSDGPQENSNASANAANLPPSRSLVADVLYETKQKSLQIITLDIRGDPFWLGLGNVDEDLLIGSGNNSPPANTAAAWWYNGDVGFLFTLRTGQAYNEQTGIMDLNDHTLMWNGFYSVMKVKSVFKAGQFTQDLTAKRDALTDAPTQTQINKKLTTAQIAAQAEITARVADLKTRGVAQ